jgi:hypothetical protein
MSSTVSVTVPDGKEAAILRQAELLWKSSYTPGDVSDEDEPEEIEEDDEPAARTRRGWGPSYVRRSYFGGISEHWRPMLNYLADRPDEWVSWEDLLDHIDLTARQASGVVGAAERRCGRRPPYEKDWQGGNRWFRMPGHVAAIIRRLADGSGG